MRAKRSLDEIVGRDHNRLERFGKKGDEVAGHMHDHITATLLGIVAGVTSTIAFAPQIRKTWTTGGKDLSYSMLSLYVAGVSLWFCYGLAIRAIALTVANAASIVFAGTCLVLKLIKERQARVPSEETRLRIAIDMDETIADSLKEHIHRYNVQFAGDVTREDLMGKHLEDFAPKERYELVRQMLGDHSFFEGLDVISDAQEVVRELARTHEVFIVSSAMEIPESFAAKYRWLRTHFPFISDKNIVFCGDKRIIDADYLIDDEARHFTKFRGNGILFSAPHNTTDARYERVASWQEVRTRLLGAEPSLIFSSKCSRKDAPAAVETAQE